jgi:hypothetical protein
MKTDLTIFGEDDFGKPLEKMTLDELTSLGTELLSYAQVLGKRTALMTYEAGRVLGEIKNRLKEDGKWVRWQMEQKLARATVANVIALYERVQDVKRLEGLTIMEAYRKFGVLPPRKHEQKRLPLPGDETTAEPEGRHPNLCGLSDGGMADCSDPGERQHEGSIIEEDNGERAGFGGDDHDVIDVPPEVITVDREALQELLHATTKDIVMSVVMECFEGVKTKVVDCLEISDDEMPLVDSAFGGVLQGKAIQADARLEVALDKMYSALLQIQDVGLQGSARETAWLLEKLVLAAQGRLKRAG